MALVSLKAILFPRQRPQTGEYQRLLDVERQQQPSCSNSDSGDLEDFDDKTSASQGRRLLRCKVNPRVIADATVGLSDGLTVPFALTAGLSALGTTQLVIYAGLAELVAGAISMGLGGYLGAKGEADGYYAALRETKDCVENDKHRASSMVFATFDKYRFPQATLESMATNLHAQPEHLVDFLMRFHHQLAEADFAPSRAYQSGATIALGYFFGGLVPLSPYFFFSDIQNALYCSILVMAVALFAFGWLKTAFVGESSKLVCFQKACEMLVLGGVAAGAAMGCVKAIGGG